MVWVKNKEELIEKSMELIGQEIDISILSKMSINIEKIVSEILKPV